MDYNNFTKETAAGLIRENNRIPTELKHIHLMGICGTAMASLAGILKEKGFRVTGSDENVYGGLLAQQLLYCSV